MAIPQRVVVLGGGFGGAYCANALARRQRKLNLTVKLIDRHNYLIFYPLLVEAGTGSLEPRHAVVPLRAMVPRADFRMAEVTSIDFAGRCVHIQLPDGGESQGIEYDHLVISLGSVTRLPPVPGLAEHGFELKSMADAVALRDRAIRMLERANSVEDVDERRRLLHFVIVGANYTGVELCGEYQVFLNKAAHRYPNIDRARDIRVTLVEMQDRILPALDEELANYARRSLEKRGVKVVLDNSVVEVGPGSVKLRTGRTLACDTCIWAAGIQPPPLIKQLGLPVDERGYIDCEPTLQVKGFDNVWAIGDCAVIRDPDGKPYPATAQHAVRQGKHAARNIMRVLRGQLPGAFVYDEVGSLASLGCRTAVAKVFGIKLSGFPAWWLWRTVYLMKMPGWGRRVRIALDWTMDLVFGNDYVQLGVHHPAGRRNDE